MKKLILTFISFVFLLMFCNVAYAETLVSDETPGTTITFSGKQWVILEQMPNGETYIILNDKDCQKAFDPDGTGLYNPIDTNNIAYYLNNTFYNGLSQKELIIDHSWDLISVNYEDGLNGTNYGDVICKIGLLSFREYEKYGQYYNGSILPITYTDGWWLRTPRAVYSNYAYYVRTDGFLSHNNPTFSQGVRPALYLKSGILISETKEVIGNIVNVESITLSKESLSLNVNDISSLIATILPENTTNKTVIWTSSDTSIATVDSSGNVVAVGPGSCVIRATTEDGGFYDECQVNVINNVNDNAPTNLSTSAGNAQVNLAWDAVSGAANYNVKRATIAGGPYETVASNVYGTTYTDITVTNGTTYFYVVTAIIDEVESLNSNEASATPQASSSEGRAVLWVTMNNGSDIDYDLSMDQVNAFINWYKSKASGGVGDPFYTLSKTPISPYTSRTDYLIFDKIVCFKVNKY